MIEASQTPVAKDDSKPTDPTTYTSVMSTPARRLRPRIADRGCIPFAELMAEALYGEGGYYRGEETPIGTGGDFVTGSSLSPLFGRATAPLSWMLPRPESVLTMESIRR